MDYICPVCKVHLKRDIDIVKPHTEAHIIDIIKEKHPEWVEEDGMCRKCFEHFKKQLHPE